MIHMARRKSAQLILTNLPFGKLVYNSRVQKYKLLYILAGFTFPTETKSPEMEQANVITWDNEEF